MSIDPTVSEYFYRMSIQKYFIDNLKIIEGITLLFDQTILYENVQSYVTDKWLVINFGVFERDLLSTNLLEINCCTRKDSEGSDLAQLADIVIGYLTDITTTDTMKRITLYDTAQNDPALWSPIGGMLVHHFQESPQVLTPDRTKTKSITAELMWGARI